MGDRVGTCAMVLGGSMAGLLAARVLADAYDEVRVVDRDELTDVTSPRRGVPQGPHAHALLARGQQVLEELFPGLTAELTAAGMLRLDMGEMHWYLEGQRLANAHTGLAAVSLTRAVLEGHVRARVAALPNVRLIEKCDVIGLVTTPDRDRVTGARVQYQAAGSAEQVMRADLVVEALGRGSRMPAWLQELGYPRVAEERVKIDLAYTTCEFLLPSRPLENDLSIISLATPMNPYGAFFGRVGGDRHQLSLTSMLSEPPSTDIEGVLACAKSLPVPHIYEAIRESEPYTRPVTIRFPYSVRRRYERLAKFPERLILVGDGLCSFNPVYGQGMTVASLEALILRRHLRGRRPPEGRQFFRDAAKVIDAPWAMAAGGDLAWPGVEGHRTPITRMMNAYMARLMAGMLSDSRITEVFMRVAGLVDQPQALIRPPVVYRVMRPSRRLAGGGQPTVTDAPWSPADQSLRQAPQGTDGNA